MKFIPIFILLLLFYSCSKKNDQVVTPVATSFSITKVQVDQKINAYNYFVSGKPDINITFSSKIDRTLVSATTIRFTQNNNAIPYDVTYSNNDSTVNIKPQSNLTPLTKYSLYISPEIKSIEKLNLSNPSTISLISSIDSTDKFPVLSDNALLDLVEKTTFKYFWDFGHPVSGMARERNTSGDVVTTGGTGFGIMSIVAAVNRNYITKTDGVARLNKIVSFLTNNCTRYHGAFSHWINGTSGATIPFSPKDNGGDLVETSYLMQGLLTARQYFNGSSADEVTLTSNINKLWNAVEWNWFRQGNQNVLYWHWSPDNGWAINMKISGWNEALIVYALAASSNTDSIPSIVYHNGWAANGNEKNGKSFYNYLLPLGPDYGGPLFFAHYSFLGINPNSLTDKYADYFTQNKNHSLINYTYCITNPNGNNLFSDAVWGLTASDDDKSGYAVHAPYNNDDGVITPTAAISSLPYTPNESMKALKFFYYKLGDKIFGDYGFIDSYNTNTLWFSNSYLAIDQGPEIVMIENYRSGLLWNLFMSCPEIKRGMKQLGFQSPYL